MEYLSEASREFTSLNIETTFKPNKTLKRDTSPCKRHSILPQKRSGSYIKYNVKPAK